MRVLLIGNLSDRRCGYQNFSTQMATALALRSDVELSTFDGTYSQVYARQQQPATMHRGMFPEDVHTYDVVHLIWHAATANHYTGAPWQWLLAQPNPPLISWWDGGPSDASCPFIEYMQVKWSDYPRVGYEYLHYPVPDWVDELPTGYGSPDHPFTVGASSVRGDGIDEIRQACKTYGWRMNLPTPGNWLSVEDEVRRLACSTVNVCWYNTPPLWHNRASAPSMLLAARRPLLINRDPLVAHLHHYRNSEGIYIGDVHAGPSMAEYLVLLERLHQSRMLSLPYTPYLELAWTPAAQRFLDVWKAAREAARG